MEWFQAMVLCILKHQSRKEKKHQGWGRAHKLTCPGANFTINPAHDFSVFYFFFLLLGISSGTMPGAMMYPAFYQLECFTELLP